MQGWNILSGKKEGLLHGIYKFELLFKGNLIDSCWRGKVIHPK